jgi:hypothetical protein
MYFKHLSYFIDVLLYCVLLCFTPLYSVMTVRVDSMAVLWNGMLSNVFVCRSCCGGAESAHFSPWTSGVVGCAGKYFSLRSCGLCWYFSLPRLAIGITI